MVKTDKELNDQKKKELKRNIEKEIGNLSTLYKKLSDDYFNMDKNGVIEAAREVACKIESTSREIERYLKEGKGLEDYLIMSQCRLYTHRSALGGLLMKISSIYDLNDAEKNYISRDYFEQP